MGSRDCHKANRWKLVQDLTRPDALPSDASPLVLFVLGIYSSSPSSPPSPPSTPLPTPPLNIPSSSEAEITRFREFKTKALRTDQWTDGRTDGWTDRPSYGELEMRLKRTKKEERVIVSELAWWQEKALSHLIWSSVRLRPRVQSRNKEAEGAKVSICSNSANQIQNSFKSGPLASPLCSLARTAHSFACSALLASQRSLIRSLTRSRARGDIGIFLSDFQSVHRETEVSGDDFSPLFTALSPASSIPRSIEQMIDQLVMHSLF